MIWADAKVVIIQGRSGRYPRFVHGYRSGYCRLRAALNKKEVLLWEDLQLSALSVVVDFGPNIF
ncbi:hypothetical protein J21TS7_11780 [Paenibacillus cineris]|uniref:Transposase n=1 Tax=Paenibacillus cineris TaxID=237530 RepID=A0ABQ4L9B1_9BACL|nr:hypothetical protein J21TS7_11780 [Paenibacillus cineris]